MSIDGIDFHPLHEMSCSLDLNPVLASSCVSACLSHRLFVTPFFLCATGDLAGVALFLLTGRYYCETHILLDIRKVFLFSLIYIPDDEALSGAVILRQLFPTLLD